MKEEKIKNSDKRYSLFPIVLIWMGISQVIMIILKNIAIPDCLFQLQEVFSDIFPSLSKVTLIESVQASIMIAMIPLMLVSLSRIRIKEATFKNLKDNSKRNMLKFSLLFLAIGFGALYFGFSSRRLGWLFTDYWFSFPLRSGFLTMYFAYALRLFIEVIFDSKKENKQQAQISNQ